MDTLGVGLITMKSKEKQTLHFHTLTFKFLDQILSEDEWNCSHTKQKLKKK